MPLPLFVIPLIKALAWGGAAVGAAFSVGKFTQESEKAYFNNGICNKCGGHYKRIEGTKKTGHKGYKCDVCDNCVWIAFGTDEGYVYKPSKKSKQ